MNRTEKRALQAQWSAAIARDRRRLHERALARMDQVRSAYPDFTVWLGGPGRGHTLYFVRELLKRLLEEDGFTTILSEEYRGGSNLASREAAEVDASNMVAVMAITPGASAESIDFANIEDMRSKLFVFIPREYRRGYVFASLQAGHRVLGGDETVFSLSRLEKHKPELAVKVLASAVDFRDRHERKMRQR